MSTEVVYWQYYLITWLVSSEVAAFHTMEQFAWLAQLFFFF